jgi:hypothetical protein
MQSFITNGCVKQILFICCTYKEQNKAYKNYSRTEYTLNNKINKKMVILEKFRKKFKIWTNYDEEIIVKTFDCSLKGEM